MNVVSLFGRLVVGLSAFTLLPLLSLHTRPDYETLSPLMDEKTQPG
jgi:hypothetical protein